MRRLLTATLVVVMLLPVTAARDPNPDADSWISAAWSFDAERIDRLSISGRISVHQARIQGEVRTADEIRDLHDQARATGQGDQFVADAESRVRTLVTGTLARFFPQSNASVQRVDLAVSSLEDADGTDGFHPAVDFEVEAGVDLDLPGDAPDDEVRERVRDALRMGGVARFEFRPRAEPGRNHTIDVSLPDHVRPVRGPDAPSTVEVLNWDGTETETRLVSIEVTGEDATIYRSTRGHVRVRIELNRLRFDVLTGQASVRTDLVATADVGAWELGPEVADRFPDTVRFEAVGADGIRLALDEGYIARSALEDARSRIADRARSAATSIFEPDTRLDVRFEEASLTGGIQGPADDTPPVRIRATAGETRTFNLYGGDTPGAAAITLTTFDRSFPVTPVAPFNTTYEILLPPGVTAEDVRVDGNASAGRTTEDGRDLVRVPLRSDADRATVTLQAGVTPLTVLHAAPALAALLLLSTFATIAYAGWRIARRRRRGGVAGEDGGGGREGGGR